MNCQGFVTPCWENKVEHDDVWEVDILQCTEGDFIMILFNPLGVHPWGQLGCQKKRNCTRNSNLWSFCSTFDIELKERSKTAQN